MTTADYSEAEAERIVAEGLTIAEQMRQRIKDIEQSRDEQPVKLAAARAAAEDARTRTLNEEPWGEAWSAIPTTDLNGELNGMMALPSIDGKELWGARCAFDFLDANGDRERIEEVLNRYFTALDANVEHLFFVFSSALCTIAEHVMPMLLENLEEYASDYVSRYLLADAARNAWATRLHNNLADPDVTEEKR